MKRFPLPICSGKVVSRLATLCSKIWFGWVKLLCQLWKYIKYNCRKCIIFLFVQKYSVWQIYGKKIALYNITLYYSGNTTLKSTKTVDNSVRHLWNKFIAHFVIEQVNIFKFNMLIKLLKIYQIDQVIECTRLPLHYIIKMITYHVSKVIYSS